MIAARLCEVATRDDSELRGKPLKQDRHQIRYEDDGQQRVAELRSAGEVGCPVARIHVPDGHQITRTGEGEDLPPPRRTRNRNAPIDLGQRRRQPRSPPSRLGLLRLFRML